MKEITKIALLSLLIISFCMAICLTQNTFADVQDFTIVCDKEVYNILQKGTLYCDVTNHLNEVIHDADLALIFHDFDDVKITEVYEWKNIPHTVMVNNISYIEHSEWIEANETQEAHWNNWTKEINNPYEDTVYYDDWKETNKLDKVAKKVKGMTFGKLETKKFKINIEVPIGSSGKFDMVTSNADYYGILDPWWNSGWSYKKLIYLNKSVLGTLTNFSYYIEVDTLSLINEDKINSDCSDLRFTNSTNEEIGWEFDDYKNNTINGCGTANTGIWMLIPEILSNNTLVYMYYGNPSASFGNTSGYDYNAKAVWHMNDKKATGTTYTTKDSKGTNDANVVGLNFNSSGAFGSGYWFNDANSSLKANHSSNIDLGGSGYADYTTELWIKMSNNSSLQRLIYKGSAPYPLQMTLRDTDPRLKAVIYDGTNVPYVAKTEMPINMHHVMFKRNASSDNIALYVDGVLIQTTTDTTVETISNTGPIRFGIECDDLDYEFVGLMDEAVIYKGTKNDDWAKMRNDIGRYIMYTIGQEEFFNLPPTSPTLLYPINQSQQSTVPEFGWNNSIDPDNDTITYTLTIDDNLDFSSPIYNNTSISEDPDGTTEITPIANLTTKTNYYWRVGANDSYNPTVWSQNRTFYYVTSWNITFNPFDSITNEALGNVFIACNNTWNNSPENGEHSLVPYMSGLWHLNENTGTAVYDETNNNNDGTAYGPSWTVGKFNYALRFDGENDYVAIPHSDSLNINGEITLEAWVKPDETFTEQKYFVWKTNSFGLSMGNTTGGELNKPGFYVMQGGVWKGVVSLDAIDANWHHIVGVYNLSGISIYVDGALKNSKLLTGNFDASANNLGIGNYIYSPMPSNYYFNGVIDEVVVWNRSLTGQEISDYYQEAQPSNYGPIEFAPDSYQCTASKSGYFNRKEKFTADSDKTIDIPMSISGYLSQEEHDWLEAIHKCLYEGDCLTYNLLAQVNETTSKIWNQFKRTDQSVVTLEDVISSEVTPTTNITINYTIAVPEKEGYGLEEGLQGYDDFLPIRVSYWFMDVEKTKCYSQGTSPSGIDLIEPYCQPLTAQTIGQINTNFNFIVDLRPSLPEGTYYLIRNVEIDPNNIWIDYGQEILGTVYVLQSGEEPVISLKPAPAATLGTGITGFAIAELLTATNISIIVSLTAIGSVGYLFIRKRH